MKLTSSDDAHKKLWISGAIKKPGAFTAQAKRAGRSVGEFAAEHKHDSGKTGQRARLAITLRSLHRKGGRGG